jgi:ABC-2 type transport system ATP-binding protein
MDEAQHLAERVAILRAGALIAEGPIDQLTGAGDRATVVRFALPHGVSADQLAAVVEAPVETSGDQASTRTEHPQRTLYKLTGWAEENSVELGGLEVRRPTLEDVFLELTGGAAEGSGDRRGPEAGASGDV